MNKRTIAQCPVCHNADSHVVAEEKSLGSLYQISQCHHCQVLFTSYQDTDRTFNAQQTDEEKFYHKYGAILRGEKKHDRHENYLEEVSIVKKYMTQGRYLDIGCHAGWLLSYLQKHTELELYGLEPNPSSAKLTSQRLHIHVFNDYVREGNFERERFDFISMTDVFEHIPNPNEILRVLYNALTSQGKLMIKVPNVEFTRVKYRLKNIFKCIIHAQDAFNAQGHYVHYSRKSLEFILQKNGFKMIEVISPLPVQTTGSKQATVVSRKAIYHLGKWGLFPSQDILVVAEKK